MDPGGKGVNCSRVLRELGSETVATGFAPGGMGRFIETTLSDLGVICDFVHTRGDVRMNMTIHNMRRNTSTMIVDSGPQTDARYLDELFERIRRHVRPGDWMVVAGSIPPPLPARAYYELITLGRELGARTVLDADGDPLREGFEAKPWVVKANRRELGRLLDRPLDDEADAVGALKDLRRGGVQVAAITRGRYGSLGMDRKGCWRALPPRIHQSTPVGAGDAFLAGIVKILSEGGVLPDALRLATAAGAAATVTEGTQLAKRSDVDAFLPRVKVQAVDVPELLAAAPRPKHKKEGRSATSASAEREG
jgi:1-phosphofructokinase family hexose kinase